MPPLICVHQGVGDKIVEWTLKNWKCILEDKIPSSQDHIFRHDPGNTQVYISSMELTINEGAEKDASGPGPEISVIKSEILRGTDSFRENCMSMGDFG